MRLVEFEYLEVEGRARYPDDPALFRVVTVVDGRVIAWYSGALLLQAHAQDPLEYAPIDHVSISRSDLRALIPFARRVVLDKVEALLESPGLQDLVPGCDEPDAVYSQFTLRDLLRTTFADWRVAAAVDRSRGATRDGLAVLIRAGLLTRGEMLRVWKAGPG